MYQLTFVGILACGALKPYPQTDYIENVKLQPDEQTNGLGMSKKYHARGAAEDSEKFLSS